MKSFGLTTAVLFALTAVSAASAATFETFKIDGSHSSVVFKINHLGFSHTFGMFPNLQGTLVFEPEDLENASIKATVNAADVNTMHEGRDDHLRNEDFFHVEEHPEISFESTKWEALGDDKYQVTGDLTLLGETKEISFVAHHLGTGEGMKGEFRKGFETTFTIQRSDFGMDYGVGGPLGDDVELTVSFEAVFSPEVPERF